MRLTPGAFLYDPNAHVRVMASQARKPRNIVLLSDGTGNSSAKLMKTNVWRMYEAVDLTKGDQLALYDNGVGTSSFKPLAMLGGAPGLGPEAQRPHALHVCVRQLSARRPHLRVRLQPRRVHHPGAHRASSPTRGSSPARRAAS